MAESSCSVELPQIYDGVLTPGALNPGIRTITAASHQEVRHVPRITIRPRDSNAVDGSGSRHDSRRERWRCRMRSSTKPTQCWRNSTRFPAYLAHLGSRIRSHCGADNPDHNSCGCCPGPVPVPVAGPRRALAASVSAQVEMGDGKLSVGAPTGVVIGVTRLGGRGLEWNSASARRPMTIPTAPRTNAADTRNNGRYQPARSVRSTVPQN